MLPLGQTECSECPRRSHRQGASFTPILSVTRDPVLLSPRPFPLPDSTPSLPPCSSPPFFFPYTFSPCCIANSKMNLKGLRMAQGSDERCQESPALENGLQQPCPSHPFTALYLLLGDLGQVT